MTTSTLSSSSSNMVVKYSVFDPIRRLCDSHGFHFFIVLESRSEPEKRYWTSSERLKNLCGGLIQAFATFVGESDDVDAAPTASYADAAAAQLGFAGLLGLVSVVGGFLAPQQAVDGVSVVGVSPVFSDVSDGVNGASSHL